MHYFGCGKKRAILLKLNKHCLVPEYLLLDPKVVQTIRKLNTNIWIMTKILFFMLTLLVLLCIYIPVGERRNCMCDS